MVIKHIKITEFYNQIKNNIDKHNQELQEIIIIILMIINNNINNKIHNHLL